MLYRGSELIREIVWIIYDEIHYMRDRERGVRRSRRTLLATPAVLALVPCRPVWLRRSGAGLCCVMSKERGGSGRTGRSG
jgi:hypothetical protein